MTFKGKTEPSRPIFISLKVFPLKYLYALKVLKYYHLINNGVSIQENKYRTKLRNAHHSLVPKPNKTFFTKSFVFIAPWLYNKLPNHIKNSLSKFRFLKNLQKWLFEVEDIDLLLKIQA